MLIQKVLFVIDDKWNIVVASCHVIITVVGSVVLVPVVVLISELMFLE